MKRIVFLVVLFVVGIPRCDIGAIAQKKANDSFQESKVITLKSSRYYCETKKDYDKPYAYVKIRDVANNRWNIPIPNPILRAGDGSDMDEESLGRVVAESRVPLAPAWVQFVVCNQDLEKEIIPLVLRCFSKKEIELLKRSQASIEFNKVFVNSSGKLVEQEVYVGARSKEFVDGAINPKHLIKIDNILKKHMTFEDFGVMDIVGLPYLADFYWRFGFRDGSIRILAKGFSTWDFALKDDRIELYKDRVESFRKEFSK